MTPYYADNWLTVYHGDARTVLAELPAESVHCVVTSPPYWGLRDYGQDGQLGLEPTPEQYVENMVTVFREVRRVLRSDGTVWLNLGDSYASHDPGGYRPGEHLNPGGRVAAKGSGRNRAGIYGRNIGLKPKDLVGIPWRVAFALQADGWVLRSDVVWAKPNPMPESVTDRPTKSHEMLFLFSKGKRLGPDPTPYDDIPEGDARWLAGIIDAEGSIVIRREQPKGNDYGGHTAQVSVGNTSRAMLDEVVRIVGSGNVLERAGLNAPMFYWQASNKVALGLLRRLYPFLIVKQRQARCAIALEEGKRYQTKLGQSEIDRRERLWQTVKSLNHFGAPDMTGIPEPVFGRWTSQPYYYDADAVREGRTDSNVSRAEAIERHGTTDGLPTGAAKLPNSPYHAHKGARRGLHGVGTTFIAVPAGRNLRSVWSIATAPYPGAHFATFPPKLVEPCIKAGTSERGVCPECGTPWVRVVEKEVQYTSGSGRAWNPPSGKNGSDYEQATSGTYDVRMGPSIRSTTTGWQSSCTCVQVVPNGTVREVLGGASDHGDVTVPATVLDPFAGSGTTGLVAQRLNRRAILIDLSMDYLGQIMERNRHVPLGV